ncbi:MAG TPA: ImmA/IrrE family metallo-endopeptidase [Methylotenera sp.]
MIQLELIEFADLVKPIDIVSLIFEQNQWIESAVPLEAIAIAAGIKDIQYAPLNSFEGTLLANDSKSEGVIVINNGAIPYRQRFTLGHELGHFMIPRHGNRMQCSKADLSAKPSKKMPLNLTIEVEANQFSAELLLPKKLIKKHSSFRNQPTIEGIKQLSELFEVSFQASAVRLADLHDDPMALVMSRYGRVIYGYKRSDFPFWLKVGNRGDLIPPKSLTGLIDTTKSETISCDECLSSLWFDNNRFYELPENLIEEVYVQEDGYVATILWFTDNIEEI